MHIYPYICVPVEGYNVLKKEREEIGFRSRTDKLYFSKADANRIQQISMKECDGGDASVDCTIFFPVFFHFCVGRVLNQESGKNRKEKSKLFRENQLHYRKWQDPNKKSK